MEVSALSLDYRPLIVLATLLVILAGCLVPVEKRASAPVMVNVRPEATASPARPTPVPLTAQPAPTATQTPVEIAASTPTAGVPVAPVRGARALDFTLPDLRNNEMSLSDLRGRRVLLNFWAT